MAKIGLLEQLKQGPLLGDGGMGTQLFEAGLGVGQCGVAWNVDEPTKVQAVHQCYADAGCDLLTTNTFQASSSALVMHGLADRVAELNQAAAKVASQAAGNTKYVLADIGPFGGFLEPLGDTTVEQLTVIFTEQLMALKAGGADAVIIETMSDTAEVTCAIKAAKAVADWPVIATYAYQHAGDGFATMMGTGVEQATSAAFDAGADVVGANCGTNLTLDDYVRLAQLLVAAAGDKPAILQPNAGAPREDHGQVVYDATPDDMAAVSCRLLDTGLKIIGGCCGTTPAHLAAMRQAMDRGV